MLVGKDMCPFPIAGSIGTKRHYKLCHLGTF